ncbi:MAG: hypothetical protein ABIL68_04160, partial [bacterium]
LINKTFTMAELADDVKEIAIDAPNDQVIFKIEADAKIDVVSKVLRFGIPGKDRRYGCGASYRDSVQMDDLGVRIDPTSKLKRGHIVFEYENPNAYEVHVDLQFLDIRLPNGVTPLVWSIDIPANRTDRNVVQLENCILRPPVRNGKNYLRYDTNVGGNVGNNVRIYFHFEEIAFQSVTGTFDAIDASFDSVEIDAPIPEAFEQFQIQSAQLTVTFRVGIKIPADIEFEIRGSDFKGPAAPPIQIDTTIAAWSGVGPIPEYTFRRDVAAFINSQPGTILISGTAKLEQAGPGVTVSADDPISGNVVFRAPLIVTLPSHTAKAEVDTLEFDEDIRDRIRENLMEIGILADIENHLPISAQVSILFSKSRGDSTLYDFPDLVIGPIGLNPATLAGDPAVVTQPALNPWNQTLTKQADISLFEEEKLYYGLRFIFNGTQGQMAKVRPQDYLKIHAQGWVKIRTTIPKDDDEEGGGS